MKLTIATILVAACAGVSASAATFDFGDAADDFKTTYGFEATWDQAVAKDGSIASDGGISITDISATYYNAATGKLQSADPFLDADTSTTLASNGRLLKNAGLGVCHKGFTWYEIEVTGRASHGSRPEEGIDRRARHRRDCGRLTLVDRRRSEKDANRGPARTSLGVRAREPPLP